MHTHCEPAVDTSRMKLMHALKHAQPVAILIFTDADVALWNRFATVKFVGRKGLCRQFVDVARLQATRHLTDVLD